MLKGGTRPGGNVGKEVQLRRADSLKSGSYGHRATNPGHAREHIFNIFCILDPTGEKFVLKNVSLDMKIKDLKAYSEFIIGIPANLQRLCYLDEGDLQDHTDVRHNDIVPGALLHLKVWNTWSTLIEAVVSGDTDWIFSLGVTQNSTFRSPTSDHMAAQHPKVRQNWLADRAFVALYIASHRGNQKLCTKLIESGANVNARSPYGRSPLHVAAARGHGNIVDLLLENGADIDAADKNGETALTVAENFGNKGCERHLFLFRWQQRAKQTLKNKIQVDLFAHQYFDSVNPVWLKGKHGQIYFTQILPPGEFEGTLINSPLRCAHCVTADGENRDDTDGAQSAEKIYPLPSLHTTSTKRSARYPDLMPAIKEESSGISQGSSEGLHYRAASKSNKQKRAQSGRTFDEWLQKKKNIEHIKLQKGREIAQKKEVKIYEKGLPAVLSGSRDKNFGTEDR